MMEKKTELPNQEKIRMLREKEKNKYLGISKADTIKQARMKEKIQKSISGERKNYTNSSHITKTSLKR